jgi:hypothetical protein
MTERTYYSIRTGKNPLKNFTLEDVKDLFLGIFCDFENRGYFQESLGYYCVDRDWVPGKLGHEMDKVILFKLRKKHLTPFNKEKISAYTEDDLFDVIEFLYDHCSEPLKGEYHSYSGCGWHYSTFETDGIGKNKFRLSINEILSKYDQGYELSEKGEILHNADHGMASLITAKPPKIDESDTNERLESAIKKFRSRSKDDRRDGIRDLADILEYLRPEAKKVLSKKDENDLFEIINRFGIRHNDLNQKKDYDLGIFYSWLFYYYVASIHAITHLIKKYKT